MKDDNLSHLTQDKDTNKIILSHSKKFFSDNNSNEVEVRIVTPPIKKKGIETHTCIEYVAELKKLQKC